MRPAQRWTTRPAINAVLTGVPAGEHAGAPWVGVYPNQADIDRLDALHASVRGVRRGGTVWVSGVCGGEADPMPLMEMFNRRPARR